MSETDNLKCISQKPKRSNFGINTGKLGSEKDFFCENCNFFVGYFSHLKWRLSK